MDSAVRTKTPTSAARALQVVALFAALVVNLYWATPFYNWDMLGYLAAAYHFGGASPEDVHRRTYRIVEETVPALDYALLTGSTATRSSEYRRTIAANPEALAQQLSSYTVKPAYPVFVLVLERAGMNPVQATVLISRLAYVLLGLVLILWLAPMMSAPAAVATAWGVMSLRFLLDLSRASTPDALSAFVVLAALWLVFQHRRFGAGASLLLLSILVRPDNLLWVLVVAGYAAVWLRRGRAAAVFAVAGIGAYLGVAAWSGHPGWLTTFHGSFVELIASPETFEPKLSPAGYLWIYLRETHPVNLPPFVVVVALIGGWLFAHRLRRHGWRDTGVALLAAAGGFAALHWIVYPGEERFLAAAYVAVLVVLLRSLIGEPVALPRATAPDHPAAVTP